jgi:hypothetical protein
MAKIGYFISISVLILPSILRIPWLCAFLVSKFLTNITAAIGASGAYFMFGSISFMGTVFVLFLVPETKGKTNEEMKSYFFAKNTKKLYNK